MSEINKISEINNITQFDILVDLYKLLDIYQTPTITSEFNDGDWNVCLHSDGKLIFTDFYGFGVSLDDAIDDAILRFFDHTPVINDVPLKKIITLLLLNNKQDNNQYDKQDNNQDNNQDAGGCKEM